MSVPFPPHNGYTLHAEVDHVIPNDNYPHVRIANTCPCKPDINGFRILHHRHRPYTEAEQQGIRQGDAYDPEDADVSDEIIARGTFARGN